MKNTILSLVIAGLFSLNAYAAPKAAVQEEMHATNFGLGFATFGLGSGAPTSPTLSANIEFGTKNSLQIFTGVDNSDPFEFTIGSIFRYNLFGNHHLNWNVGAGFNLGTVGKTATTTTGSTTDFYMNLLLPTTGLKFSLGGALSNVKLSFDGGVMMHITPSPFRMYLAPFNSFLGAAIHYYF